MFGIGQSKDLVGLDVGSHTIKVAEVKELRKGRGYQLVNFGVGQIPPEAIVDGSILDASLVIETIQKIFSDKGIKNRQVVLGLSGSSVTIKRISLPRMSYEELSESIRWEAEQYLPFGIDDVNIDFRILETAAGTEDENMDVLLVAAKKDKINDYVSVVSQAGLTPLAVDVVAFALQNCYEINHPVEGDTATALIDIGASVTAINVMVGESTVFWRDITMGGNKYNEALQRDLGMSQEEAETVKLDPASGSYPVEQVISGLNEVSEELVNEIKKTLDFFRSSIMDQPVEKVLLSGGCARVTNLDKIIGEKAQVSVEILNPFAHVFVDPKKFDFEWLAQYVPAASVAVGLGIRKVGDF